MISVSTDKSRLDIPFIHNFLKDIYWTAPRTIEEVQTVIENSFCFGIYLDGQQIGFARVITDYVVFAYVMDVFIDADYRGKGYSKQLMHYILNLEQLSEIKIWRLATKDAHGLYQQFGFKQHDIPENLLELIKNKD